MDDLTPNYVQDRLVLIRNAVEEIYDVDPNGPLFVARLLSQLLKEEILDQRQAG